MKRKKLLLIGCCVAGAVMAYIAIYCQAKESIQHTNADADDFRAILACSQQEYQRLAPTLEALLAEIVGDKNGDGQTRITLSFYNFDDYSMDRNGFTQLQLDAAENQSSAVLYLITTDTIMLAGQSDTALFGSGLFCALPEDAADTDCAYRVSLKGAPFLEALELETLPLYGCIWNSDEEDTMAEEQQEALEILLQLKTIVPEEAEGSAVP